MKKMLLMVVVFLTLSVCFSSGIICADTLILNDNERVKGVVVEDYQDRIIISTMDGEKVYMRDDIRQVNYDLKEQNFTSIAEYYLDKKDYGKAYYYFNKALEINPGFERAKDGLNHTGTYLHQVERLKKLDHIRKMNATVERKRGGIVLEEKGPEDQLKDDLGIELKSKESFFEILSVVPGSPSDKAGLKKGDILLAAWGRALGYMQIDDVIKRLLKSGVMDIKVTIARTFVMPIEDKWGDYKTLMGIELDYSEMAGIVIKEIVPDGPADKDGFQKGDVLIGFDGKMTRYMPIEQINNIVVSRKGKDLVMTIERNVVIWKKFEKVKV